MDDHVKIKIHEILYVCISEEVKYVFHFVKQTKKLDLNSL